MAAFDLAWLPRSIWSDFVQSAERNGLEKTPTGFEKYLLHLLLSEYRLDAKIGEVHTGGVGDNFIDGMIITVNGKPIEVRADFFAQLGADVKDFQIEFIQITSQQAFSREKLDNLARGVVYFLQGSNAIPANDRIQKKREIRSFIASELEKNAVEPVPNIIITYIYPGDISKDDRILFEDLEKRLNANFPSQRAAIKIIDKQDIMTLISQERLTNTGYLNRHSLVSCPSVIGAEATFVGYASAHEILKLVIRPDDDARINYSVFFENVRAFLGWTEVNKSIAATLQDPLRRSEFLLRNNGITITARSHSWERYKLRLAGC